MSTQYIRYPDNGSGDSGVTSLNGQTGDLSLVAGSGITITPGSGTLTIAATGGGGTVTDVTASAPLLSSGGTTPNISIPVATSSANGYLSSTDWSTFNGKQAAGNYITALTGDGTASGPGSVALTLATVNASPNNYGQANAVGAFTVNGKGLVTAASNIPIVISESQVTNLVSDLAGKQPVGNYITALTGDVTAAGPGSVAATLATVNGNVGSFGSSTSIPSFTVNGKGLITAASGNVVIAPAGTLSGTTLNATVVSSSLTSVGTITSGTWTGTPIAIANGGTGQTSQTAAFDALAPTTTKGDLIVNNGTDNIRVGVGTDGDVLTADSGAASGVSWQPSASTPAVVAIYYLSADASVTANTPIDYDVQVLDTGTLVTTGPAWVFTAPTTGAYEINMSTLSDAGSTIQVFINGTVYSYITTSVSTGFTSGAVVVSLQANDTLDLRPDTTATFRGVSMGIIQSQISIFMVK